MEAMRARMVLGLVPDILGVVAGDLLWALVPEVLRTSLATLAHHLALLLGPGALPIALAALTAAQWARQVQDGATVARAVRERLF